MTGRLMTAEELARLPEVDCRYELVRGEPVRIPYAGSRSSIVSAMIGIRVSRHAEDHALGLVSSAGGGFLIASAPDTVRAPNLGFVRTERIPPDGIPSGYWPGAPDFAVEVLSPSDRFADVLRKVAEYLAAGTRLVWVIDPEARTATVFRPDALPETAGSDGVLSGEEALPGFTLRLAEVWV